MYVKRRNSCNMPLSNGTSCTLALLRTTKGSNLQLLVQRQHSFINTQNISTQCWGKIHKQRNEHPEDCICILIVISLNVINTCKIQWNLTAIFVEHCRNVALIWVCFIHQNNIGPVLKENYPIFATRESRAAQKSNVDGAADQLDGEWLHGKAFQTGHGE